MGNLKLIMKKKTIRLMGHIVSKDIVDISKFNFYPTVGITAGVRHFRFNVSYQYGINNMLDNLNTSSWGLILKSWNT
jgi:hypothetical protein